MIVFQGWIYTKYTSFPFENSFYTFWIDRNTMIDSQKFGDNKYSEEELVAELEAAFLCCMTGIDRNPIIENSSAYIKGWLGILRKDKKFVFRTSSAAQKAVDYITNYSNEQK